MLLVIGYLLVYRNGLTFTDTLVIDWYEIFMLTLLSGGVLLQTVSSIRYWYWDYYYKLYPWEKPVPSVVDPTTG